MRHVKGPDFPTGGVIIGKSGIRAAYATGRGSLKLRAKTEIITDVHGKTEIVVSDIPYQLITKDLLGEIAEKMKEKIVEGIAVMRDETDREGFRIVFELKRDANAQVVLNQLFANTQLQISFGITQLALINRGRQPKILTLRELLDEYITFQVEVIVRRTKYDLKKARDRSHILEGLRIAVDNIDEVIKTIRSAYSDAKEQLMSRFSLSDVQAQAILELQLRRIQGLERDKVEDEYNALQAKIVYYIELLDDEQMQRDVLEKELLEIKEKFGDERRTDIEIFEDEIDIEDLIDEEECVFTLTHAGYIKRQTADTYKSQRRGGKGITAMTTKEEDYVETLFTASTHDYLLFFTNNGRVFRKKGYQIPESGRTAKGGNIINLISTEPGEKVTAMLHFREMEADIEKYLFMVTRHGTVKKCRVAEFKNLRNNGLRTVTLDEGDELIQVLETSGSDNILIGTRNGMATCFKETDVRATGRTSMGVRGIRLKEGDECVGASRLERGQIVLTVTENGYGRRTESDEYIRGDGEVQHRGGKGLRNGKLTDKTGMVVDVRVVTEDEDLMLITDGGTIIRTGANTVNVIGRTGQGVRLMRVPDGVKVISIATTEKAIEVETTDENEGADGATITHDLSIDVEVEPPVELPVETDETTVESGDGVEEV
jgi:DNA gyrase subunit A